jgi:DNA-binding Lrp family transcriptional regulator
MSAGAYVLVRFSDRDKLLPAIEALDGMNKISRWDAVDGHFNLIVKLESNDPKLVEKISKLDGCSDIASCELMSDNDNGSAPTTDYSYSYIFVETERYQQKAVQSSIEKNEDVAFCSPTSGNCDLVALVKGENFDLIDRTVNTTIRQLDGVLRLKQDRVIFLDRM